MATISETSGAALTERLAALARHRRRIAIVAIAAAVATVLLAFLLPPVYQSTATILIEQQEIPQDLVRSTITSFADQRVQVISQRVMTSQNLMQIIDQYGLYPKIRRNRPREELLQKMRDDVRMQMVSADVIDPRSGRPTRANIAFTVAYENRSADLAYKVANELTSLYLNENSSSRAKQAEQAATFLKDEADRLDKEIAGYDAKLAEFKAKYSESLPELSQLNITSMERTDSELREVRNRLGTLSQQRLLMEAQLAQINPSSALFADSGQRILSPEDRLKAARSALAGATARYSPDHPDVRSAQRDVEGLEKQTDAELDINDINRRLDLVRGQLASAKERYTSEHPDVRRLEREAERLEALAANAPATARPTPSRPDNPAYIQVKGQLDALQSERDTLLKKERDLSAKLANYEQRLATGPVVERDYRSLLRDADSARLKYQEVRAKQIEAEVSKNLEVERKGERFTLIEPPLAPEAPISPKRWLILTLGLFASLIGGIAAGWLAESSSGTVRGPYDLRTLLSVPPLATVPDIVTSEQRSTSRRGRLRWFAGVTIVLAVALLLIHFFLIPIDVVGDVLLRRMGAT